MKRSSKLVIATCAAGVVAGLGVLGCSHAKRAPGGMVAMDAGYYTASGQAIDDPHFNTEDYDHIVENEFIAVADDPLSTFSIDVDTASYSNVRRFLSDGALPPPDAVRIEELVNYFDYDYKPPSGPAPFSMTSEVGDCPWTPDHRLVHVGLQGKTIAPEKIPPRNLVFLLDVSGSMGSPDKLPLLKRAMALLVPQLREEDHVSIVVYAGASGLVLPPTAGNEHARILAALDSLESGGSTNGGEGIRLAYEMAQKSFAQGGINRVILATDGDFNVGTSSRGGLLRLIEQKRKSGVFLSVFGFGTGNLKDSSMEQLADHGNGNYAYIDGLTEARKVLVEQAGATLVTIAKDVKIQVEFNPTEVASYRLIGYENRILAHQDFNDDKKDAGEIGAGHTVTALYEVVPATNAKPKGGKVDALRYQEGRKPTSASTSDELMTVKIRYKKPDADKSELLSFAVDDKVQPVAKTSTAFRFSAAVAGFAMLLRQSKHVGNFELANVLELASDSRGQDPHGYRSEFLELVRKAALLSGKQS